MAITRSNYNPIISSLNVTASKPTILHPDNKDVVIFPKMIGDKYYALHRPSCTCVGYAETTLQFIKENLSLGSLTR